MAACTGSIPAGTTTNSSAFTATASRHVPALCGKITNASTATFVTSWFTSATIPAPSNPGVAGSGARTGYFPSIWFKSAGLIGAARIFTITSPAAGVGHGRDSTCNTSAGFPCVSYTAAFIVFMMSSPQHPQASANNLQTRRPPGGMTSSAWQTGARVALFGMIVNSIFAVAKILGGFFGHAYVLIADGIESGLDVAGSFVIWSGLKVAARPPDASHPYGHGKAEPIAAMIVAAGVVAAAVGLAIQSVREIFLPHHAPAPFTLGILIVVIVVKETLFRYVNRIGRSVESTAVQTDAWHHRSDALTSAAALIGGKHWQSADDWAAIFACVVIAANGVRLMRPAFYEIMDTAPRKIVKSVCSIASTVPGVIEVEKCRARKMGLEFYVDLHVGVDGKISVHQGHEIAHRVKTAIQQNDSRIADVLVHIDPAQL